MIAYKAERQRPWRSSSTPPVTQEMHRKFGGIFDPSFIELRKYVRVGGLESDLRVLDPTEFHANTTELVQMLAKGHHGVELDQEAWDRLFTWIDLNAPATERGPRSIGKNRVSPYNTRRRELQQLYAVPKPDAGGHLGGSAVSQCSDSAEAVAAEESDPDRGL